MEPWLLAVVDLLVLHMVDGREVVIIPQQITRLDQARAGDDVHKQLHPDVRCVVYLTDGKYVSVAEECSVVKEMLR